MANGKRNRVFVCAVVFLVLLFQSGTVKAGFFDSVIRKFQREVQSAVDDMVKNISEMIRRLEMVDWQKFACGRYYEYTLEAFEKGDASSEKEWVGGQIGRTIVRGRCRYIEDSDAARLLQELAQCIQVDCTSTSLRQRTAEGRDFCYTQNNFGSCTNPLGAGDRLVVDYVSNPYPTMRGGANFPDLHRNVLCIPSDVETLRQMTRACFTEAGF